jgi:hypothetical protein
MSPDNPWSNDPAATSSAAAAEPSRDRKKEAVAFDSVPVDPAIFETVVYRGCEPKYENQSDDDYRAGREKQQKLKDGVPVWSLKLAAVMRPSGNYREREGDIKVSWTSHDDPSEVFERYQPVELLEPRFGVTSYRRRNGAEAFAIYWSALDVRPVGVKSKPTPLPSPMAS